MNKSFHIVAISVVLVALFSSVSALPTLRREDVTRLQQANPTSVSGSTARAAPAANPLKGLPELPKYHYLCESISEQYILDPTSFGGIIVDYARITGSISAAVTNATIAKAAVKVCAKAQAASNHSRRVGIGLNFGCTVSPSSNRTKMQEEADTFITSMRNQVLNIEAANEDLGTNITVNAVQFDCESQWAGSYGNAAAVAVSLANEFQYNATRAVFPSHDVVIINYDYGQAEWWPNGNPSFPMCNRTWEQFSHAIGKPEMSSSEVLPDGWCVRPAPMVYTEHFESDAAFSCSLYEISEPQLTRERFFYTSELARIYGVQDAAVIPYVSLGQGWIREGTTRHGIEFANSFSFNRDYTTAYSALMGAQINRPEYEMRTWGQWDRCKAVVFFQHAFTPVSEADKAANNTGPGTFHMMEHFVACKFLWLLTTFFQAMSFI